MKVRIGAFAAVTIGSVLAGCASLPADRGSGDVEKLVTSRSAVAVQWNPVGNARSSELPATPLDADAAVRVAMANSPRIRVLYAELGIAQADVYDATRLSNPSLGFERLSVSSGGTQKTWSLSQGFVELLFARYRGRMGRLQLLEAQQRVAHEVLVLEAEVRSAWLNHAAARLTARLWSGSARAAQVSAELAARFHEAGNITALQLAREQAEASSAVIAVRRQEGAVAHARARLLVLMGVQDQPDLALQDRLPLPVLLAADLESLQRTALAQRLDLQALRTGVTWSMKQQGQVQRWRWVNGVTIAAVRERDPDATTLNGGSVSLELPLFNTGNGRRLRASAGREIAEATLAGAEIDVTADVAVRFAVLQAEAQNVAEYHEHLLPLRQRIVELTQQRQNYMLVGAFELIEARRQDIEAWQAYIESLHDYALARTDLARAVGGRLPGAETETETVSIPELPLAEQTGEAR
ncbi:MAG: TolC family protein [Pseudomonadota bacterium]